MIPGAPRPVGPHVLGSFGLSGTKEDPRASAMHVREASLAVSAAAGVVRLEANGSLLVGTGEGVDLRLADAKVSRRHARFALGERGVVVSDEGSRNGTWVGPLRVERATLTESSRVRVGDTVINVTIDEQARALPISRRTSLGDAIGFSAPMRHVFSLAERAAATDVTVLLEGESGVGKEVLARALHAHSPRAAGELVTVDCGSIPKELLESELFGHERGAFTGATAPRVGLFGQADGGTLFLDEIGELPLELQPKLLRALEAREIRAVGSNRPRPIDVRVVAATNRSLVDEVRHGRFRQDLFYRLSVARIHVPALRDREGDIDVLATSFYREALRDPNAVLPGEILELLRAYRWPGNVRELKNVVQRYALLGFSGRNLFDDAPEARLVRRSAPLPGGEDFGGLGYHAARQAILDRFEAAFVADALARAGGVMLRAAELAGLARSSFYRMVEKHGVRAGERE